MKTFFKFVTININDIETDDTRFQITNKKNSDDIEKSINDIGLLNPPLLLKKEKGFIIISGFRRVEALKRCGIETFEARVVDSENEHVCPQIAVLDNSFQRTLTVVEQIKSVRILAGCYSENETNVAFYNDICSVLHIPLNKSYVMKLWRATTLSEDVLNLIENERISLDVALDVLDFSPVVQEKISLIMSDYKISLSKQKELILFIREISARDKCSIEDVIDDILAELNDWQHISDMNARFGKARAYLKKRRYPEMTDVLEKHESLVSSLSIPQGMKFTAPDFLEGSVFSLQLTFKTKPELENLNMMLDRICSKPEMEMILKREYNFT